MDNKQIEDIVKILDGFVEKGDSRMKVEISDELKEGEIKRTYHHGRCDVGSPWACGEAFDAQTEE